MLYYILPLNLIRIFVVTLHMSLVPRTPGSGSTLVAARHFCDHPPRPPNAVRIRFQGRKTQYLLNCCLFLVVLGTQKCRKWTWKWEKKQGESANFLCIRLRNFAIVQFRAWRLITAALQPLLLAIMCDSGRFRTFTISSDDPWSPVGLLFS